MPDPAATSRPLHRLIDQSGRRCRRARGERAAQRLPSADPSSFYELAGLVAGQPPRDPSFQPAKLPIVIQLSPGPALLRPASR